MSALTLFNNYSHDFLDIFQECIKISDVSCKINYLIPLLYTDTKRHSISKIMIAYTQINKVQEVNL